MEMLKNAGMAHIDMDLMFAIPATSEEALAAMKTIVDAERFICFGRYNRQNI